MTSRLARAPIVITFFPECCRKPRQNQFECNQFFFRTRQAAISSTSQGWELAASCDISDTKHQSHRQTSGGFDRFSPLLIAVRLYLFLTLFPSHTRQRFSDEMASQQPQQPIFPPPSTAIPVQIPADSSVWDRISSWVSEHKAVVYTIAGVTVAVAAGGVVYYSTNSVSIAHKYQYARPSMLSPLREHEHVGSRLPVLVSFGLLS